MADADATTRPSNGGGTSPWQVGPSEHVGCAGRCGFVSVWGERREVDSKVATRPASSAIMQWAFMQMVALAALVAPTSAWVASSGVARPVAPPCAVVSHEPRCSVLRLQSHDDDDEDDEELTDAEVDTSGKIIERVPAALRGVPSVPMANRSIYIPPLSPLIAASALTRSALSAVGRLS